MIFNVAGLIASSVGETRCYSFSDPFDCGALVPVKTLVAEVELMRTDCAILATCEAVGEVATECVRCTAPISVEVPVKFEEEFWPCNFSLTGRRKRTSFLSDEPGGLTIDDKNMLNLFPVISDAFLASTPLAPLCAETCKGLCPGCSFNRNVTVCLCDAEKPQPNSMK